MAMVEYYLSSLPDDKADLIAVTDGGDGAATGNDDTNFSDSRVLDQRSAMELDLQDIRHDKQNYNVQNAARSTALNHSTKTRLTVGIMCA